MSQSQSALVKRVKRKSSFSITLQAGLIASLASQVFVNSRGGFATVADGADDKIRPAHKISAREYAGHAGHLVLDLIRGWYAGSGVPINEIAWRRSCLA